MSSRETVRCAPAPPIAADTVERLFVVPPVWFILSASLVARVSVQVQLPGDAAQLVVPAVPATAVTSAATAASWIRLVPLDVVPFPAVLTRNISTSPPLALKPPGDRMFVGKVVFGTAMTPT